VIGEECIVGTGCQLTDMTVSDRVTVRPYCVAEGSVVEADVRLGPFARLRRGTLIQAGADIGNFIEIKKSTIGRKVKAHHVGYLGDATVGEGANVGAGTITCNYDGVAKHETTIGARAFVGTNSSLVAPLTIGDDAYVGAGSVITRRPAGGAGRRAGPPGDQGGLDRAPTGPEARPGAAPGLVRPQAPSRFAQHVPRPGVALVKQRASADPRDAAFGRVARWLLHQRPRITG
jgi:acetyltransferase-like isoleucine patch superfamily enzyme